MNCGLCAKELEIIQEILSRYEAIQSAVLFGSSVTGNFKTASDIDIALKGAITIKLIAKIKAEFEDSTLPFFVDIVDYAKADNALKNEIDTQGVMLYPHFKATTTTWQRVKLGEIAEIKTDIWKVGGEQEQYIGLEHIAAYSLRLCGIGNSNEVSSNKYIFKENDILFGKLRPYFRKIIKAKFKGVCSTDIWVIRAKQNIDQTFLFYFFANKTLINLSYSSSKGTRMPRADWNFLSQTTWLLPPLETQRKIAEILSSLDDKIDLLHRQNKTLESLALTLFRHTFIDNPKRNEWQIGKLGDYVKIELGGTPNTAKSEYWGGDIAWINSGEINKFRIIKPTKTITKLGFEKSNTKLLPKGSVVIAITGATLGQVSLLEIDSCANQSVVGVIPNNDFSSEFLYLWIKFNIDKIILNQTGGAQQHINKNDIANYPIIKPSKEFLANVNLKIYFEKISHNMKEIQNLESLRDIMLPKLLSGEMEV